MYQKYILYLNLSIYINIFDIFIIYIKFINIFVKAKYLNNCLEFWKVKINKKIKKLVF